MIDLSECTRTLVQPGKGLLAADESPTTADKYLAKYSIEGGEEMRHLERELFLNAPMIEKYLSGVILHTETLTQKGEDGRLFAEELWDRGIVPGIKVDEGTEPIEGSKEVITKGLIGLPERLQEYRSKYRTGFTKWRSVIRIEGDTLPTASALVENARRLAMYAKQVQETGMVAIVEPEVLLEGTHSRLRAKEVLKETHSIVMNALLDSAVDLSGVIVKTSMALSGNKSGRRDTPEEVAVDTIEALVASIPKEILGIVFLSGGQEPDQATENLRAITKIAHEKSAPWPLTFSYARALQEEAIDVWRGEEKNVDKAREAFLSRLEKVSNALR